MKLKYVVLFLLLMGTHFARGQSRGAVKGSVKTSDGQPAAFVNLTVKGTSFSTTTNENGVFELRALEAGTYTLAITLVGHETRETQIEVKAGETVPIETIILNENAQELSEIVVTSSKINGFNDAESDYVSKLPLKKLENAQVYTTISKNLLNEQLVFSVDDGMRNAPGVQKMWEATSRSGDGGSYYNSRGFVLQSSLRNGVAGNITTRIDAANLERIEVIKGPSATLFGSSLTSYGGLINRVTKKAYDKTGGEVVVSYGSFGFNRVSADVNTPLDPEKKILLRVNTAYQTDGSFQDNGFDKSFVFAPTITYKVNDRLTLSMEAELYSGTNTGKQMVFFYYPSSQLGTTHAEDLGIDYKRSYSDNSVYQTSSNTNLFGQASYKISDTWRSQTNFTSTHSYSNGPGAYFYLLPNSAVTGDPAATGADYLVRADQSVASSAEDAVELQQNFLGDFHIKSTRHRFVGGIDYYRIDSKRLFYGVDPFDTIPKNGVIPGYANFNADNLNAALQSSRKYVYPYNFKSNTLSAYVADVVNITERLIVSAAIRADHFTNTGSFDVTTGSYDGAYKQTAFSPKFGAIYQIVKDRISLFGNYQNGFTNQTGTDYEGKNFKPEHANQKEGGIKFDVYNSRISGTISYYDIQVQDLVRPYAGNPNFSIQDGTQRSKGVEVEIIANPFTGFNIVAGFAHNNSAYTNSAEDVQGRRPATAMAPDAANLWMSYRISNGPAKGLGVGFGGNYAGANKIVNSDSFGEMILPKYTVINATVFYDQPKFRFGFKSDNLTNKEYWIGYTTMNPQNLRSFTGSLAIKF